MGMREREREREREGLAYSNMEKTPCCVCWRVSEGEREREWEKERERESRLDMDKKKELTTRNIPKLKIILLGDSGVGKTSLINQYVYKKFQSKPIPDFQDALLKDLDLEGKHVTLQIQDTRGQERQGAGDLEATFFNDVKGCMLVYDVNNAKSFSNLENWHNLFTTRVISNSSGLKNVPFIVLGNKIDIDGGKNKKVYHERASNWCRSKGIYNMLTSAKDNKCVSEAFQHVAQLALEKDLDNNGVFTQGQRNAKKEFQSTPANGMSTAMTSLMSVPQLPSAYPSKPMSEPLSIPSNGLHTTSFMSGSQKPTSAYSHNPMNQIETNNSPSNTS